MRMIVTQGKSVERGGMKTFSILIAGDEKFPKYFSLASRNAVEAADVYLSL
jgi:hypothetical protein